MWVGVTFILRRVGARLKRVESTAETVTGIITPPFSHFYRIVAGHPRGGEK